MINIKLSQAGENLAIFFDFEYISDGNGGNSALTKFNVENLSGNSMLINIGQNGKNPKTNKYETTWSDLIEADCLKIEFRGSYEREEFLTMLKLILETEGMMDILQVR